jgi:hypothetical protein
MAACWYIDNFIKKTLEASKHQGFQNLFGTKAIEFYQLSPSTVLKSVHCFCSSSVISSFFLI